MPALRYAILWHDGIREPHFDLMFETLPGSALATWRSRRWPIDAATPIVRLKDHRREYLDYEGDLTERRGRVTRVAAGACAVEVGEDAAWTIAFLTGPPPGTLILQMMDGEQWQARPG